ncbi:hypothetical protein H1R20_g13857, partial [Candolleomyces eurysporus]
MLNKLGLAPEWMKALSATGSHVELPTSPEAVHGEPSEGENGDDIKSDDSDSGGTDGDRYLTDLDELNVFIDFELED